MTTSKTVSETASFETLMEAGIKWLTSGREPPGAVISHLGLTVPVHIPWSGPGWLSLTACRRETRGSGAQKLHACSVCTSGPDDGRRGG